MNNGDRYTPAWLDRSGNRLIFPSEKGLFEESGPALAMQVTSVSSFRSIGLDPDGFAKLIDKDGVLQITHVECEFGYWTGLCIAGPIFDHAKPLEQ